MPSFVSHFCHILCHTLCHNLCHILCHNLCHIFCHILCHIFLILQIKYLIIFLIYLIFRNKIFRLNDFVVFQITDFLLLCLQLLTYIQHSAQSIYSMYVTLYTAVQNVSLSHACLYARTFSDLCMNQNTHRALCGG